MKQTETQPCRESNVAAIVDYFESGFKPARGFVGIELEHTLVHRADGAPVTYSEEHGVRWLLEQLQQWYPDTTYDGDHDLLGVARSDSGIIEAVTLEPAAQVELSAGPFSSLHDALDCFQNFDDNLAKLIDGVGEELMEIGYHPTAHAQETELIPKRRYRFMDMYLRNIGVYGPSMMRCTASTQVSIDAEDAEDCLRKMRLANKLVPIFSLVTDNAPIFEGMPREHELMRTEVWKYCDPDRCNLVPGVVEDGFGLRDYAEYILDTPAILVPCKTAEWCFSEKTFGELYADTPMQRSDVEHAVSMLFNDVRLKTYIEIRPADSLPPEYAIAYAALIKGLFANDESMAAAERLVAECTLNSDVAEAKEELMAKGYDATVYGKPVWQLAERLFLVAKLGLPKDERELLEPLMELCLNRTTLADLTVVTTA